MNTTLTFEIQKEAKSSGGDKFVCKTMPFFNIYFPQKISRDENGFVKKRNNYDICLNISTFFLQEN